MRTFNEADRLADALGAAQMLGGELVVIDSGSTDETVAIAERHGARVVHNPWPGFGPQRFFGEDQCGHDMILSLDADEIVTREFAAEVRGLFLSGNPPRLMRVKKAFVLPHWKKPPPLPFCAVHIYLYDRRIARTMSNPNTDTLAVTAPDRPHTVKAVLWHFSLRDWSHGIAKANYVAKLAAETGRPRPTAELLVRLVTELPLSFLKFYFARRYFLAGADGFSMAMVSAIGRWLRIAMMLEHQRLRKAS
jgi:glycosyltransferase involved in cell wall biosynthesis